MKIPSESERIPTLDTVTTVNNVPDGFTAMNQFLPEDVFVVGWPKSGNTWFQNLVSGVVHGVNIEQAPPKLAHDLVPDVHFDKFYRRYSTPMFFKSHFLPRPEYKKVVYLLRDGRDAMVSYFHYLQALETEASSFMDLVVTGRELFPCKWHEHVEAWRQNPYNAEMITIRYEDLVKQPVDELARFCQFIGLERKREELQAVAEATRFQKLKAREQKFGFGRRDHAFAQGKYFFRRGVPGSHKDEMPSDVLEAFQEESGETLQRCGYMEQKEVSPVFEAKGSVSLPQAPQSDGNGSSPMDIGVVLPTFNCAALLKDHLKSMESWLDLVSEVVVVDSHSSDGTLELIRKHLHHPRLRVYFHPRGLYQSWNFGIGRLSTKYAYISTVGDSITRAGLEHLNAVARNLGTDVVVSKPRFITNEGADVKERIVWPIDDVVRSLVLEKPVVLTDLRLFYFTLFHLPAAMLGSSASNLYLTSVLQRRPFPTGYGTVGDGAWGAINVFNYRLGVTPEVFSTFRHHPKAYSAREYAVPDLAGKLFDLACGAYYKQLTIDAGLREKAERMGFKDFPEILRDHRKWHNRLERERERSLPWILNPRAWQARRRRNRDERLTFKTRRAVIEAPGEVPAEPVAL